MLPRQPMASLPCCYVPWRSLALAVSKTLWDMPLHILFLALGCLLGLDEWPPGASAPSLCVLRLLLVTAKAIILLSWVTRGERSLRRSQNRDPGAEVLCVHIYTQICLFLSPRSVDPLVFLRDERIGRADFLLMDVLTCLTCPQVSRAAWTAVIPLLPWALLPCICLEHKCQNKHTRYRGVSQTITEPILTDHLRL